MFSLVFRGVDGDLWVEELLIGLPGGQLGFLIVVNALVFVLAFFLDFFELAFIVVPLLAPVAEKLGIDLIWFGVLLGVNMQTSFMHPPFGFALFYLRSVAPTASYVDRVTGGRWPASPPARSTWARSRSSASSSSWSPGHRLPGAGRPRRQGDRPTDRHSASPPDAPDEPPPVEYR